jgi:hypothetical protein
MVKRKSYFDKRGIVTYISNPLAELLNNIKKENNVGNSKACEIIADLAHTGKELSKYDLFAALRKKQ